MTKINPKVVEEVDAEMQAVVDHLLKAISKLAKTTPIPLVVFALAQLLAKGMRAMCEYHNVPSDKLYSEVSGLLKPSGPARGPYVQ